MTAQSTASTEIGMLRPLHKLQITHGSSLGVQSPSLGVQRPPLSVQRPARSVQRPVPGVNRLEVKSITVSDICFVFSKFLIFVALMLNSRCLLVSADTINTHSGNFVVEIWLPLWSYTFPSPSIGFLALKNMDLGQKIMFLSQLGGKLCPNVSNVGSFCRNQDFWALM